MHELNDNTYNVSNIRTNDCKILKGTYERLVEGWIIKIRTSCGKMLSDYHGSTHRFGVTSCAHYKISCSYMTWLRKRPIDVR
jgi:hypothetical protein